MKKYILSIITAVIMAGSANAQEILIDNIKEGIRHIACKTEGVGAKFTDKTSLSCALSYFGNEEASLYNISFRLKQLSSIRVEKGSEILIRLRDENETVLKLTVSSGDEDRIGKLETEPIVLTTYSIYISAHITTEQIEAIAKHGVKKLRINTPTAPIDWEYKKDKIGKTISPQYELIQETLSKAAQNDESTF